EVCPAVAGSRTEKVRSRRFHDHSGFDCTARPGTSAIQHRGRAFLLREVPRRTGSSDRFDPDAQQHRLGPGGERQGCQHAARAGSGSADRTEPAESKPNSSTVTAGTAKPAAELILGFTAIAIGSILKGRGFNPRPPSNHRFPLCPPCP